MGKVKKRTLRFLFKITYWVIPILILVVIFRRIDVDLFIEHIQKINMWTALAGLFFYPVAIIAASMRWRKALDLYSQIQIGLQEAIRHYWTGLALGILSPAMIGMDLYRIVVVGRKYKAFVRVAISIVVEKMMALLNAVALILILFPIVNRYIKDDSMLAHDVYQYAYYIIVAMALMFVMLSLFVRHRLFGYVRNHFRGYVVRVVHKLRSVMPDKLSNKINLDSELGAKHLFYFKSLVPVFLASLMIQVAAAAGNQLFFQSIGYDIPYLVNLFVIPITYFIFLLPISFGSIGVREASYIILYGLFGVPAEVAIVVSFLSMLGMLTNNVLGAIIMWMNRKQVNTIIHDSEESARESR